MNNNVKQLEASLKGLVNNQDTTVRQFFYQQFAKPAGSVGFGPLTGTVANYYSSMSGDVFANANGTSDAALAKLNALIAEEKTLNEQLAREGEVLSSVTQSFKDWQYRFEIGCNTMSKKSRPGCKAESTERMSYYKTLIEASNGRSNTIKAQIAAKKKAIETAQIEYNKEANKTTTERNQEAIVDAQAQAIATSAQSRASNLKILAIGAATMIVLGGITFLILRSKS